MAPAPVASMAAAMSAERPEDRMAPELEVPGEATAAPPRACRTLPPRRPAPVVVTETDLISAAELVPVESVPGGPVAVGLAAPERMPAATQRMLRAAEAEEPGAEALEVAPAAYLLAPVAEPEDAVPARVEAAEALAAATAVWVESPADPPALAEEAWAAWRAPAAPRHRAALVLVAPERAMRPLTAATDQPAFPKTMLHSVPPWA